uniref:General transcription factor IIIC subunit 1 n=1 Tax=Gasterosteus aculeatus aculeatus TaxID=481459 RepID=G3Q7E0_GASAC|nr:general transcription factor 3C polypeptide 1 isoform X1 [Gasterosteus aculeatus aculeatus]
MEPLSIVVDEVALEGLDGITIPSLWIRLEGRKPAFPLKLDDCTKDFLWRSLLNNGDLKFYQLPQERGDVQLFDRFKNIDPDTGIERRMSFSDAPKDVYPISITPENQHGIQGSCAVLKERTDVTQHVRSKSLAPLLDLPEALERYGRKLVVVASQMLRFRALIGIDSDPDLKLTDFSFCVLERVGRARWQGELQSDLHGSTFKIDAGKLHYMRKALVKHGLITMQSHITRAHSGQQQHSILLLLKRFHVNRRTKYDMLMEYVSNFLLQSPGHFVSVLVLKEQLSSINERSFRLLIRYMRSAKLIEHCQYPLEDLDPEAGPCTNKSGKKVLVRCLKQVKPYAGKGVADDDDEDDDEDYANRALPLEGRIMETDVLTQAYHIVLSAGSKGIKQTDLGLRMNVGRLESRMICRRLEREALIKGFMVDEGRQRTTRYISHRCVGVSNQLQMVAKEQERKKLLYSSPQTSEREPPGPETPPASTSKGAVNAKPRAAKKLQTAGGGGGDEDKDAKEAGRTCGGGGEEAADVSGEGLDGEGGAAGRKSGVGRKKAGRKSAVKTSQPETAAARTSPAECETPASGESTSSATPDSESTPRAALFKEDESSSLLEGLNAADNPDDTNIELVTDVCKPQTREKSSRYLARSHETYRLLRRRNLIIEAVRTFKIVEGFFLLQKIINEEEKKNGLNTKCCRKTVVRLVDGLSREGLLKVYKTTVVQDGINKKLEMIVHPSIQPSDDVVRGVIEQVRFKISSSYSAVRRKNEEEDASKQSPGPEDAKGAACENLPRDKRKEDDFRPKTVRGLGKTLGFQPKMHRLQVVHSFLCHVIYGHPAINDPTDVRPAARTPADASGSDAKAPADANGRARPPEGQPADSTAADLDVALSSDDEEEVKDKATSARPQSDLKVYADEDTWKKFVPPVRVHKGFISGWAMVGDLLLCMPLSIFIQVIQVNYKVDGLEEYLSDPVKQHHLIRALPARMKRQLLYKRRYIFSFHVNLQKLVYMGLLLFGPVEKFTDKDQVFVYLRRHATIVDTTSADPHYWLVTESPEKPFERRRYTFNTSEDVENYWFDLMCVCLNTPLGIVRSKRSADNETAPSFLHERHVFAGLAYLLKGSREVSDDWSTPGDGKGAAGLDSEFFAHLKRNWLWTNHLLMSKSTPSGSVSKENKIRLKSLLTRNAFRIVLKAGGTTAPRYVTNKRPLITEIVTLGVEPATRNKRVVGGKKQKRKRIKQQAVKAPRKNKEPKKRTPAHDEADHRAIKMMTRQRVYWSVQEDSLMMLCRVAAHLLNSKLKRPYVPYCVVRDLLQAEYETSMDKTSVAVGRRTRYILKNPQTLLNYRICLAEAYQDKPLMKLLESKKPADPENSDDCAKSFSEYARLLREKFRSVLSTTDLVIPDTKPQLFSRFKVSAIESVRKVARKDTLNCTDDIHTLVLENLIQSTLAMTNAQMKSSRSFQTFHMYSQYKQELLCQIFIRFRKRGLVNRRRIHHLFGPKKNRALPFLPMSYQLSHSYHRCFSWRFPHSLVSNSLRFLRGLLRNGTGDDRPAVEFFHETVNRSPSGEEATEKRAASGKKQRKKDEGGPVGEAQAAIVDAATEGDDDDDGDRTGAPGAEEAMEEATSEKTQAPGEADDQQTPAEGLPAGPAEERPGGEQADDAPPTGEESPDVSDMMFFSMDSADGGCAVSLSLMSLGLLSVLVSVPRQMVVVDSNLLDTSLVKSVGALEEEEDDDEDDAEECDGKKKLEVKSQASHTKYLMMRGHRSPGIVKLRNLNTTDSIVVESCFVRLKLRDTPAHHLFPQERISPLDLRKSGVRQLPSVLTAFTRCSSSPSPGELQECHARLTQQRGYTAQDIEACVQLRSSLAAAGENGLDVGDLHRGHQHLEEPRAGRTRSLQKYMQDLEEEGQVSKVGGLGARWVLLQHADPWLLTVNSKHWSNSSTACDRLPFLQKGHKIPFLRKRSRREAPKEAGEPPAKKSPPVEPAGEDGPGGTSGDATKEALREEEQPGGQRERADQGGADESPNPEAEGGKPSPPGEDGERKAAETEGRRPERKLRRVRLKSIDGAGEEAAGSAAGADDPSNRSFISRPWRMVDGNLNRQVCKFMLEAVMYHVMSRPGLTQQTLVEHYKDKLQPMAVLDLLQALIELGCVTRNTLSRPPKASLFSLAVHTTSAETPVEDPGLVFYEPTISCLLRLGKAIPEERHTHYTQWTSSPT